jgi:YHS domain-containing protein
MEIDPGSVDAERTIMRRTFYFCSQSCLEKVEAVPNQYSQPIEEENEPKSLSGSLTTGYHPAASIVQVSLPIFESNKRRNSDPQRVVRSLLAGNGILICSGEALQTAQEVRTVVLDKRR